MSVIMIEVFLKYTKKEKALNATLIVSAEIKD